MSSSLSSFIPKDTRRMLLCEQLAENFKLDESTYHTDGFDGLWLAGFGFLQTFEVADACFLNRL
jgi:hypothetical protein